MKAKTKGLIFLWLGNLLAAASSSVISKLGILGAHHQIHGRNPISFCNVLFLANFIAGLTLFAIHHKKWALSKIKTIKAKQWGVMLILALISGILTPTLYFLAIMLTKVINVVLISVLEIPLTILFGLLFIRDKPTLGTLIGAALALIGVFLTFFLHEPTMSAHMKMMRANIGTGAFAHFVTSLPRGGEIFTLLAVICSVSADFIAKKAIESIPIGVFSVFRMIIGSTIFFFVALGVFGWGHFGDLFSPFLWEWMVVYGGLIIALGIWIWYLGVKDTTSSDLAVANSFNPVAGVIFAFLIVGEIPEKAQYIGGVVILMGIGVALFEKLVKKKDLPKLKKPRGFRGV